MFAEKLLIANENLMVDADLKDDDTVDDNYYEKLDKEELIDIIKVLETDLFKVRAENMKL